MPLAPSRTAWRVSRSMVERLKLVPAPLTLMARTTPPSFSASENTENDARPAMSLTSTMGKSKRRSGLSVP